MKPEIQPVTPSQIGLTLAVLSGPRGSVRDGDWPCIEYTCQLSDSRRRVIWTGEYRLGVGHVDCKKAIPGYGHPYNFGLNESVLTAWRAGKTLKKTTGVMRAQADLAAQFATRQKVAPKLEDVCHSLLMDGSAYFDGLRFEDWAADFGYSDDSIKAKETFEACDRIGRDLSRALSRDEIAGLREWASNY